MCVPFETGMPRRASKMVKASIVGTYIQPDCGSARKGMPLNWCGFQPGIWPRDPDIEGGAVPEEETDRDGEETATDNVWIQAGAVIGHASLPRISVGHKAWPD